MAKSPGRKKRTELQGDNALPLYYQVYLVLREQLAEGRFPEDEPLPGEEQLREQFDVSRVTIRKTLGRLEDEGLIRRVRGSGTYPIKQELTADDRANISGLYENLLTVGMQTKADLLSFDMIDTPAPLMLEAPELGSRVLKVERVRKYEKESFSFMRSFIPEQIGAQIKKKDIGNEPLLVVLDRAGLLPTSAEQSLSATAATAEIANELGVSIGSPLIYMKRLSRDQNDRLIEFFESFYRPDKFEYKMTLSRTPSAKAPRWVPKNT